MLAEAIVLIPKSANKGTEIQMDVLPLVLCKDCKHGKVNPCSEFTTCFHEGSCLYGNTRKSDWFCADGESKEVK